ncbi:MAG: hypothetical protein V3V08_25530 [Nannocystaceae bacterium]
MNPRFTFFTVPALLCVGLAVGACQTDGNSSLGTHAEVRSGALMQGKEIEIELGDGVDESRVREIAAFAEQRSGVEQVRVKVEDNGDGGGQLTLELWGPAVGTTELTPLLRGQFPWLRGVTIRELGLQGRPPSGGTEAVNIEGDDPETAKKKIVEQLRADGVEGAIDVTLSDEGGHRKVEVRVEKHVAD